MVEWVLFVRVGHVFWPHIMHIETNQSDRVQCRMGRVANGFRRFQRQTANRQSDEEAQNRTDHLGGHRPHLLHVICNPVQVKTWMQQIFTLCNSYTSKYLFLMLKLIKKKWFRTIFFACLDFVVYNTPKFDWVCATQMQLHVQLVWKNLARVAGVQLSRVAGGRRQWHTGALARLACLKRAAHHVRFRLCGAWAERDHQAARRILCAQQLAHLFAQFFLLFVIGFSDRDQIRLHLILFTQQTTYKYIV